jgi:hypothetical protein
VKRLLVVGILVVIAAFAVDAIGDATQTRADERDTSRQTEVTFHLKSRNYRQSLDTAAQALYGSCSATVPGDLVDPGVQAVGDGTYKFAVTPTLGEHGRERLLGCINDLSIDRVKSNIESIDDVPREVAAG